jgi:hypothetical protein
MTLIIQKPTGAKLNLAQTYVGIDDPDAAVYVAAVEAADGQSLETATKVAIHSFVKGCKADGIWPAIKASCILAGARTLTGALVPLVGTAPTNVSNNFVSGDYDRKLGLTGNATNKVLDSNVNHVGFPQNSRHLSVYHTLRVTESNGAYIGTNGTTGHSIIGRGSIADNIVTRLVQSTGAVTSVASYTSAAGFLGINRNNPSDYDARANGSTVNSGASPSQLPANQNIFVFGLNSTTRLTAARLAFYSIGESIDLAKLDTRVSALITAIGAAIP